MRFMGDRIESRRPDGNAGRYRILALDVDGTLLDPGGTLRPRTAAAVARAARAGIRPVLCTGRRYRRARPVTEQLGLDAPIVCNSGAIVKDPASHGTLWRADFDAALAADVRALFHLHDQPAVVFTDRTPDDSDFRVPAFPTGRAPFDDYVAQNRVHAEIDPEWSPAGVPVGRGEAGPNGEPWFHVCAIGTYEEMLDFERSARERIDGRIQTFVLRSSRYLGTMCEILRVDASKWTALLHLAELWGVGPDEICAVGDDANDIPMIRHAGLGVAMGHAHADVLTAADIVTGRHDEDGVAMLVDEILLA
jgi:hydroxymethylpyrimidine pyrophosphatase-like HAD family hydrolase